MRGIMIASSQDHALQQLLQRLPDLEPLTHYRRYCESRAHGHRKQAFEQLERFLQAFQSQTLDFKIWFARVVLDQAETVIDGDCGPLPHPLKELAIKPALQLWSDRDPTATQPLYWLAKFFQDRDALQQALQRDPLAQKPLALDIEQKIGRLDFSTHHLPDSYIGDPDTDLSLLAEVGLLIEKVQDIPTKSRLDQELQFFSSLISSYRQWQASGEVSFAAWAAKHEKVAESGVKTYHIER
ncbi:MAG: hypothetical protein IPO40_11310 [Fibrobacteres bacterium]|nr:hypothetical protein [Fibrobacterota bacterium]